jgi:hypothetical protein
MRQCGVIFFEFDDQYEKNALEVHVFIAHKYEGTPTESEEMLPEWYDLNDIPYKYVLILLSFIDLCGKMINFGFQQCWEVKTLERILYLEISRQLSHLSYNSYQMKNKRAHHIMILEMIMT